MASKAAREIALRIAKADVNANRWALTLKPLYVFRVYQKQPEPIRLGNHNPLMKKIDEYQAEHPEEFTEEAFYAYARELKNRHDAAAAAVETKEDDGGNQIKKDAEDVDVLV